MTKIYSTIVFVSFLLVAGATKAQTSTLPTDTASLPFVVADIVTTIQDAVEQPSETNAYVKMMFEMSGFPELNVGQAMSETELDNLKAWIIQNPAEIEKLLIARKKNHDKYFNPGTINQ